MVMTMKKSLALSVLVAMLLAVMFTFATPFVANAATCTATTGSTATGADNGKVPTACVDKDGNLVINGGNFNQNGDSTSVWTTVLDKYRFFIVGVSGIGAITMVVLFIMQFLKLGASAGNPTARSQALVGVLWTGIAAAGLGSVSLIVGLFYHGLQ